jgi:hypothetical protein
VVVSVTYQVVVAGVHRVVGFGGFHHRGRSASGGRALVERPEKSARLLTAQ